MRNSHFLVLGFIIILLSQACTERMICPAYQSAFIHDEGTLERHFSYFNEDSTPKILEASKSKFLIIEPLSYRKKLRSLRTVEMKDIYPIEDDSLEFAAEFALAEVDKGGDLYDSADLVRDIEYNNQTDADTTPVDSSYVISIVKEKFNIDQELYLWYMRKYLVYPDVKIQLQDEAEAKQALEAAEPKEKKGFFGFFKNLFKKKNKDELDQAETDGTEDLSSATAVPDGENVEGKEKEKGGFSLFKKNKDKKKKEKKPKEKKSKKKKNKEDPPPKEQQEEEEEDDGEDDF